MCKSSYVVEEWFHMTRVFSLASSISLCSASFWHSMPNLTVICYLTSLLTNPQGQYEVGHFGASSWTSFYVFIEAFNFSLLHYSLGRDSDFHDLEWFFLGIN